MDKSYVLETSVFMKKILILKKSTKKFYQKLFSIRKSKGLFLEKLYLVPATDCYHFEY